MRVNGFESSSEHGRIHVHRILVSGLFRFSLNHLKSVTFISELEVFQAGFPDRVSL